MINLYVDYLDTFFDQNFTFLYFSLLRKFSSSRLLAYPDGTSENKYSEGIQPDQLSEAILELKKAIEEYKPETYSDPESFRQLANGVLQAEGCVTG